MDNEQGEPRRVGVELEFSGLGIETIVRIVKSVLGGEIDPISPYEYKVRETSLGDFGIELDYAYLKKLGRRDQPAADIERLSEDLLAAVAKQVVPFEIVGPPVPIDRLGELEPLIAALREAGARGTDDSPIYAFGLHLNPELPALDAVTIHAYLRSFAVLFDWLQKVSRVDISRRVFPYIQPFPRAYVDLLLETGTPDLAELIDDYLTYNPTRNRALDMLPLWRHLDAARVDAVIDDQLVNARPTLHYRLPNCEIENPDWQLIQPWQHWLAVEHLAADPPALDEACIAYRAHRDKWLSGLVGNWADQAGEWAWVPDGP